MSKEDLMGKGNIHGLMAPIMMETGLIIKNKDQANINLIMALCSVGTGLMIKEMGLEN